MEKSSSEESAIHRSPSVDSRDSDFAQASTSGRPFGGRGFTAGAFYGSTGPRKDAQQAQAGAAADNSAGDKTNNKYTSPKGSKYVVFYLDLSFVFLLEFKKCNMARGCLCCLKYMMFIFNLIFWLGVGTWCLSTMGYEGGRVRGMLYLDTPGTALLYLRHSSNHKVTAAGGEVRL
ncbi:hypothetical protein NQZ68_027367 [Dissostichus eleginoides]|nr:hypothetical protein NQZ68_027367 [Dissostichus eleginoides]